MSRVYILGAGASKFAGYPLADELWSFLQNISSGEHMDKKRREDIKQIERCMQESDERNLERLFTHLDLNELFPGGPVKCKYIQWSELRPKLIGVISDSFQAWQYELQWNIIRRGLQVNFPSGDSIDGIKVSEVLDAWTQKIGAGDKIISFNWDILHEVALWKARKWNYADGYGFKVDNVSPEMTSPVEVLKLHGSANWVQEWETDGGAAIEEIRTFFVNSLAEESTVLLAAAQWDAGRKPLVTPTYLKNIAGNRLLLNIWSQAARCLRNAEEVVVIGYSLNKADLPARYLIATSIRENLQYDKVELVMPDSGEWGDFCSRVGIRIRSVKDKFEAWVLRSAA